MSVALALFTYFAYVFIVVAYTVKVVKYLKLPVHLRWELYPMMDNERSRYGGSHFEDVDWWKEPRRKSLWRAIVFLSKDYLFLASYYKHQKAYWAVLYLAHVSFVLLMLFQVFLILGAAVETVYVAVGPDSGHLWVRIFYYLTILAGVVSFGTGIVGNVGLYLRRVTDPDLRAYATPAMYLGYLFNISICLAGLYAWRAVDTGFSQYRAFYAGLFTLSPMSVGFPMGIFIFLLALHLIYLPFTRSLHYITRFFAFFCIRWDDAPNIRGGELEARLKKAMEGRLTWSAPHIRTGKNWGEQVGDKIP